jgi:hypothetical protein
MNKSSTPNFLAKQPRTASLKILVRYESKKVLQIAYRSATKTTATVYTARLMRFNSGPKSSPGGASMICPMVVKLDRAVES